MFVKICGITNSQDALLAVALGADALGFVFAPSPRRVEPDIVKTIIAQLPREVMTFGVFQNERPEKVVEIVHSVGLSGAQLHGDGGPQISEYVSSRVRYTVRAFSAGKESLGAVKAHRAWAFLVDSPNPGSGKVFDWSLVDAIPERSRLILAGGLNESNIEGAIAAVAPFGVDVSTGVESTPGHKDPVRLRSFISLARDAANKLPVPSAHLDDEQGLGPYNWEINS